MKTILSAVLGATALAAIGATAASAAGQKAEVFHWWTSGGESAAVRELAKAFEAKGGEWVDTAIAGSGSTARPIGISRILGGDPPAAMQLNTGTQMNDLADGGYLRSLDDLAAQQGWKDALPPTFYAAIQHDGHIWAAPINDHGQNWIWYSKPVFAQAGITAEPKSWDELFADLDKIKAAGLIPVAVGGQPWELTLMFNSILLSAGGRDLYYKVWKDRDTAALQSPEFKKVAETFARLREYQDPGSPNREWNLATGMLVQGKAGIQFMGDWAKGEFIAAGKVAETDYGCLLGPGEENFITSGDVFVFPKLKDSAAADAQTLLATVIMSKEGQVAFNSKKGSVPVRMDVDTSALDACAQKGLAVLKDTQRQISTPDFLAPQDLVQTINDVTSQYWTTPSMSAEDFAAHWIDAIKQAQ
jgi:glucose/mannose transport system substrate-binding protein